ncbi:unnamed protein product [marine sediment metagenome]|uniref:Uncharacterized protein n=1 Tax=marine sediment metagenome TaxID=412755 RepID=X0ZFL8_9ZZZZ
MENLYRAEHAMEQPVCSVCASAYAMDGADHCAGCRAEAYFSQQEADERETKKQ